MEEDIKKEKWAPEMKLAYLPDFPRELFVEEAGFLYKEFQENYYRVVKRPAATPQHVGHETTFLENKNPRWYSQIYSSHNRPRRRLVEKSLWRLVNRLDGDLCRGSKPKYNYDAIIRELIYSRFVDGYQEGRNAWVSPNNDVRAFFGLERVEDPDEEPVSNREEYDDVVPF